MRNPNIVIFLPLLVLCISCWRIIFAAPPLAHKLHLHKVKTLKTTTVTPPPPSTLAKIDIKSIQSHQVKSSPNIALNKPFVKFPNDSSINVATYKLAHNFNLTLIYGKGNNKLNHTNAETFCKRLGGNLHTNGQQYVISHLISVHNLILSKKLMDFVLQHERNQFWIGGKVTKVMNRNTGALGYTMSWTDHTPDNYRRIHRPDLHLENMGIDESQCVSVDYLSGRWGVHKCSKEMNFVCATFLVDPEEQSKHVEKLEPDDEAMHGEVTVPPRQREPIRDDGEPLPPRTDDEE